LTCRAYGTLSFQRISIHRLTPVAGRLPPLRGSERNLGKGFLDDLLPRFSQTLRRLEHFPNRIHVCGRDLRGRNPKPGYVFQLKERFHQSEGVDET